MDTLTKVVESPMFGSAVGALIILNGIMMGVQTDYDFGAMSPPWQTFDLVQEYFFTVAFTLELCLKMFVYKMSFLTGQERNWNIFDFCLISFSVLDTFIFPAVSDNGAEMGNMSVFRMFRLVRLARLVRLLRVFRQLWLFVVGLGKAFTILFWAVLLILLVTYMAAIYVTRALAELTHDSAFIDDHFGSVLKSMFTLFQITTGDSWASGVARPVCKDQPYMVLFFVMYVGVTQFAFLNVVVAVIVESVLQHAMASDDESLKKAEAELKTALLTLYEAFTEMDVDGDLQVTREEFLQGMENVKVKLALSKVDISPQDAQEMFDILDVDQSGSLKMEEFIEGCVRGRGPAKAKDLLALTFCSKKTIYQNDVTATQISNLEKSMTQMQERFDRLEEMIASNSGAPANRTGYPSSANVEKSMTQMQKRFDRLEEMIASNSGVPANRTGYPSSAIAVGFPPCNGSPGVADDQSACNTEMVEWLCKQLSNWSATRSSATRSELNHGSKSSPSSLSHEVQPERELSPDSTTEAGPEVPVSMHSTARTYLLPEVPNAAAQR
jgi:voltage-gated sodium channel